MAYGLICVRPWSKCFTCINSSYLHNNSAVGDCRCCREEVGVQRDWATLLKVTNVVGGGAGIARVSVVLLGSES